jgi:hypothetical protein
MPHIFPSPLILFDLITVLTRCSAKGTDYEVHYSFKNKLRKANIVHTVKGEELKTKIFHIFGSK